MDNIFSSRFLIRKGLLDFMKKSLGQSFGTVIDVGAGKSPYRNLIKCQKYIGVDVEKRADVENLIIADLNVSLPLDSNMADAVIMTEVIEHLRDPKIAMSEVCRVLKPGGKLILTTPLLWPLHEPPNDFQRFTKYGLENLLTETGFKDIKITSLGNYALSDLILKQFPLRKKIFAPLNLLSNLLGLLFWKFPWGSSVYMISNYVTAIK